jgi:hypothetical protein
MPSTQTTPSVTTITTIVDSSEVLPLAHNGWEATHANLKYDRTCSECHERLLKGRFTLHIRRTEEAREKLAQRKPHLSLSNLNKTYAFCDVTCQRRKYVTMLAKATKFRKVRVVR